MTRLPHLSRTLRSALALGAAVVFGSGCATFGEYGSETEFGYGVRGTLPMERLVSDDAGTLGRSISRLEFSGSVHRSTPGDLTWTEFNADLVRPLFRIGDNAARTYVGGGVMLGRSDLDGVGSDTEVGLNVVGGIRTTRRAFAPFAEARGSVGGIEQLSLVLGVQLFGGAF